VLPLEVREVSQEEALQWRVFKAREVSPAAQLEAGSQVPEVSRVVVPTRVAVPEVSPEADFQVVEVAGGHARFSEKLLVLSSLTGFSAELIPVLNPEWLEDHNGHSTTCRRWPHLDTRQFQIRDTLRIGAAGQ
jgi:hypothetical protein